MFLRNVVVYERVFGLLYLQPYTLIKLLLNPSFPEGEKLFKLIKDLYIRSSAAPEKNLTYLMLLCLTLLKFEKREIIQMNLHLSVIDLYSLKVYNLIIGSIERLSDYFEDLKREMLEDIISVIREKTRIASDPRLGSKPGFSASFWALSKGPAASNIALSLLKASNLDLQAKQEEEQADTLEREVFLKILEKFLMILESDFKRIDLNLRIIPIPLVHLNSKIAQEIRDSKSHSNAEDKKAFSSLLKSFIVEVFFGLFFENLPKKDDIWDEIVEDKRQGMNKAVIGLITEVINVMSTVFQKRSADSLFDKWIDGPMPGDADYAGSDSAKKADDQNQLNVGSARSGASQSDKEGGNRKFYLDRIKSIVELVYQGIAVTNADGYDISERNLVQNIKHSYSEVEDVLTLSTGELMGYKQLLIDIYRNREKYKPFLSEDNTFQDPLRTVLHYLSHDDLENVTMELNDEMQTVNLCLANKFFETLNPKQDKYVQRKCTTSNIVLPTYLLKETDRMYIHELNSKGWPCVISKSVGGVSKKIIHHNNDLAFMNCTGYCEETSKVQKRCDLYISQTSLELSSIFSKISIYCLFPNEPEDISQKFAFLESFMHLLKTCPDFDSARELLRLLTASDKIVEQCKPTEFERLMTRHFKKDRSFDGIIEKVRSIFLIGIDLNRMDPISISVCSQRLKLLIDKASDYLEYIENHKQYQERCGQYISVIANTIRDEINLIDKNNTEILKSIFSLIDDLVEIQPSLTELFREVIRDEEKKDEDLTETDLTNLVKILDNINNNISVEQFTLFRLESEGIIKNFSFVKQSKFFDM